MKKYEIRYIRPLDKNAGGLSIMTVEAKDKNKARKYFLEKMMNRRKGVVIESIREKENIQL
ncbi:MAG: hypothetical protein MJZ37_00790 [Bacilli bacterium]|nr:hypothetical protein [Bacilli bacterium]